MVANPSRWRPAHAGHPWAQFRLAQTLDVPGRNRARSLELTAAATNAGVAKAAAALGTQYREGRGGVPRDPAETARWFAVAAENGGPEAPNNLGLMHHRSEGVPRHLHDALKWMRAVGRLYLAGPDTVGQNLSEARTWLASAASRGRRESQRLLAKLDRVQAAERDHARRPQLL